MAPTTLVVNAAHDPEAGVWFVESSDLPGLNVEVPTLDALVEVVADLAPDLIETNLPGASEPIHISVQHVVTPRTADAAWRGGNLYPTLARLLRAKGCASVRQGKGSHEIWFSPLTNRRFTVPRNTTKTHTANQVLKDAGLPKAF